MMAAIGEQAFWGDSPNDSRHMYRTQEGSASDMDLPRNSQAYFSHEQPSSAPVNFPATSGFPFNHVPDTQPFSQPPATDPMVRFIQQEGAWNSAPLSQSSIIPSGGPQYGPTFMGMRMADPSESASFVTGPDGRDSGYRTKTQTYSAGSGEPKDGNQDCNEAVNSLQQLHPFASNTSRPSTTPNTPPASVHTDELDTPASQGQELQKCPYCTTALRLNSEMKKHVLRHEKPFCCPLEGCPKSKKGCGFTTPNDLDRHKRTRHKIFPPQAKVYVCASPGCAEAGRSWPRFDNFKQHVERMHKDEDTNLLLTESQKILNSGDPLLAEASDHLSEVSSHPPVSHAQQQAGGSYQQDAEEAAQYNSYGASVSDSSFSQAQPSFPDGSTNDVGFEAQPFVHGEGGSSPGFAAYQSNGTQSYFVGHAQNGLTQATSHPTSDMIIDGTYTQTPLFTSPQSCPDPQDRTWSYLPSSRRAPSIVVHQPTFRQQHNERDLGHDDINLESQAVARQAVAGVFEESDLFDSRSVTQLESPATRNRSQSLSTSYVARRRARPRHGSAAGSLPDISSTIVNLDQSERRSITPGGVQCNICHKVLPRNCDMKKHMRRHSRPFGCTHGMCHKQFGSKNDWKRHETSQHSQEDLWRCEMSYKKTIGTRNGDKVMDVQCNKIYFSADTFSTHLHQRHDATMEQADVCCRANRIGRNHQETFWCGFCTRICPLVNQRKKAWDERFDHIGDHFLREGRRISEWFPPQGHQTVKQLQELRVLGQPSQDNGTFETSSGDDEEANLVHPDSPDSSAVVVQIDPVTLQPTTEQIPPSTTSNVSNGQDAGGAAKDDRKIKRRSDQNQNTYCCICQDPFSDWMGSCVRCSHSGCDECFGSRTKKARH